MKSPVFFITFLMLALFLEACSWRSEIACLKNCAVDEVLKYEKTSFVFELNQNANAKSPLWKFDDPIDSCTIKPALPSGLTFKGDCSIEGIPTESAPMQIYTVTAKAKNNTVTAKISLATSVDGVVPEEHGNFNFVVNTAINKKLSHSSAVPKDCRIQPKLALGLSLSDSCQLTGVPLVSSQLKNYTVSSIVDNVYKEEIYKITVVGTDDPDLIFMIDARRADGTNPVKTTAITYSSLTQSVSDLSILNRPTNFELTNLTSTMGAGTGTPDDPYRFLATAGVLNVTNPNDLKFAETSGTLISYFHYKNYYQFSAVAFNIYLLNFWGFNSSFQYSSATPNFFSFDGWHQLGYVIDRPNNKTYTYMDGELKHTAVGVPPNSNQISNFVMSGDFAHLSVYKKVLSEAEIANSCKSFQGVYSQLSCASESRALQLQAITSIYPMVNDCSPVNWKLLNSTGTTTASHMDLKFDLSGPNVLYFSDSTCTVPSPTYTVAAGATAGKIYFKPQNSGLFVQTAQPQKASMAATSTQQNYYGIATSLQYGFDPGCIGDSSFIYIAALDNNARSTYLKSPITVNIFDGTTTRQVTFGDVAQPFGKSYPVTSNKTYTMSVVGGTFNGGTVTIGAQTSCGGD